MTRTNCDAVKQGVQYLDTRTNNLLHVMGERGKGVYNYYGYWEKTLVSVENFVRKLPAERFNNRTITLHL